MTLLEALSKAFMASALPILFGNAAQNRSRSASVQGATSALARVLSFDIFWLIDSGSWLLAAGLWALSGGLPYSFPTNTVPTPADQKGDPILAG